MPVSAKRCRNESMAAGAGRNCPATQRDGFGAGAGRICGAVWPDKRTRARLPRRKSEPARLTEQGKEGGARKGAAFTTRNPYAAAPTKKGHRKPQEGADRPRKTQPPRHARAKAPAAPPEAAGGIRAAQISRNKKMRKIVWVEGLKNGTKKARLRRALMALDGPFCPTRGIAGPTRQRARHQGGAHSASDQERPTKPEHRPPRPLEGRTERPRWGKRDRKRRPTTAAATAALLAAIQTKQAAPLLLVAGTTGHYRPSEAAARATAKPGLPRPWPTAARRAS